MAVTDVAHEGEHYQLRELADNIQVTQESLSALATICLDLLWHVEKNTIHPIPELDALRYSTELFRREATSLGKTAAEIEKVAFAEVSA